jgi:hypothetical protein
MATLDVLDLISSLLSLDPSELCWRLLAETSSSVVKRALAFVNSRKEAMKITGSFLAVGLQAFLLEQGGLSQNAFRRGQRHV